MPIKSKKIKIKDNASASLSAWLFVQAKRKGKAEKQIKCCKKREIVADLRYRNFGVSRNIISGVACLKHML